MSRRIVFELDGAQGVLKLEVKEDTDIDDVRKALKAECANQLGQFDAVQLKLYLTTDGKVADSQPALNPTDLHSVITEKSLVVIHHPPYKTQVHSQIVGQKRSYIEASSNELPPFGSPNYLAMLTKTFPRQKGVLTAAATVWEEVKQNTGVGKEADLTDGSVRDIPFVSLLRKEAVRDRFVFSTQIAVRTLCRPKLKSLISATAENQKVFVWGNKGCGKSHLMNTFAFLRFCEHMQDFSKPRVIWLPHLGEFMSNPSNGLFEALLLAFFDAPEKIAEIVSILQETPKKDLFDVLQEWMREENVVLLADNFNVLEKQSPFVDNDTRLTVIAFVTSFVSRCHSVAYCASANEISVSLVTGKQDAVQKVLVFGDPIEDMRALFYAKFSTFKERTEKAENYALRAASSSQVRTAVKLKYLVDEVFFDATKQLTQTKKKAIIALRDWTDAKKAYDKASTYYEEINQSCTKANANKKKPAHDAKTECYGRLELEQQELDDAKSAETDAQNKVNDLRPQWEAIVTNIDEVKRQAAFGTEIEKTFDALIKRISKFDKLAGEKYKLKFQTCLMTIKPDASEIKHLEVEFFDRKAINWAKLGDKTGGILMAMNDFLSKYDHTEMSFTESLSTWAAEQGKLVKKHIQDYFIDLTRSRTNEEMKLAWMYLYSAATNSSNLTNPALIDCAYFRPGEEKGQMDWTHVYPVSEVARLAALELWLENQPSSDKSWQDPLHQLLSSRSINTSVCGFIDEKIVLTILAHVNYSVGFDAHEIDVHHVIQFDDETISDLGNKLAAHNCVQLNPVKWNYPSVDSIVLSRARNSMVAIQVTRQVPSCPEKAEKTTKFFTSAHWRLFAVDDRAWSKHILWISKSPLLPPNQIDFEHWHMSFEEVFEMGNIPWSDPFP